MSSELGLAVTAKGVEAPETLDQLRGLTFDRAQGFGIAAPLPAAEVQGYLAGSVAAPQLAAM